MNVHEQPTLDERALIEQAFQALHAQTGLSLRLEEQESDAVVPVRYDAIAWLDNTRYVIEAKRWAQHANTGALIEQIKRLPQPALLIADYINSNLVDRLRNNGVQFVDTAGNAFINDPPRLVLIKGNKKPAIRRSKATIRTFTTAGLKVVFALLNNPKLADATYREIANAATVALGTVNDVLNDLKHSGYLIEKKGKGRRLANYRKLLDRWVEAYPEQLRPKLLVGEFAASTPDWWQTMDIKAYHAYWSGEVAAAQTTGYLRPQVATLYLPKESGSKLLSDARLRKADGSKTTTGLVKIYRPFWKTDDSYNGRAPAILLYADLVASGDPRNMEVARMIYDETLSLPTD